MAAAAVPAYNPAATAELLAAIPAEINRAVKKNTSNLFPGGAPQKHYDFPLIQELLRRGADPNGSTNFKGSTIEKIIDVISEQSPKHQRAGLALFELLLQNGARPDHEYEYTSSVTRKKSTRIAWLQLFQYITLMVNDPDASILSEWIHVLNKYGFNFASPLFIEYVKEDMMLDCVVDQRLKTALDLFIRFGFPLAVAESFINKCNVDEKSYLQNTIRKGLAMRIDFSAPVAGAGAGGADAGAKNIPPLMPHVKAKIAKFIGGRSKRSKSRKGCSKSRVRRHLRSTRCK